ncbi:MAG: tetratricopeptide repeat protein [Acidobacteria bacterium]|nr:tetratricopeptide repeat protein [Acidobacteriota bacterium]MBI3663687.1 tetratricopeptide repeat protein [Acidobacteriota bacterium]
MRPFAKPALVLLLSSVSALPALGIPQQKTTKAPESKRRTVRVEDPQQALLAQAEEAIEKKDFPRAVDALKKYLAEKPADALAHVQLGYAYVGLAQREKARAEFSRAIELDAKLAEAHLNLGLLLLDQEPAVAIAPLSKVVELRPEQAWPRQLLGTAYERTGKLPEAVEQYRAAARLDAKNSEVRTDFGRALLGLNRAREAETAFREALQIEPKSVGARLGLAQSLLSQEKTEAAAPELAAYLELSPEDHGTRLRFASVLAGLGKYEPALAELDRVDARRGNTPEGFKLRAEIRLHQNNLPEAIAALEKAAQLEPRDADLHARLGRVWLERREFAPAERELLEALRLNPKLTDAVRDLVAVYYLGEKYEATLRVQDELARRETPGAGWWFVRATCYDKLHMKPDAIAAYEKFRSLDQGRSDKQDFQARQRIRILKRELERNK